LSCHVYIHLVTALFQYCEYCHLTLDKSNGKFCSIDKKNLSPSKSVITNMFMGH